MTIKFWQFLKKSILIVLLYTLVIQPIEAKNTSLKFNLSCIKTEFKLDTIVEKRYRIRNLGVKSGILTPGKFNAIADVKGVTVGYKTLIKGDSIRIRVTVILPYEGDLFQEIFNQKLT
jgi:hypothetical protein